MGDVYIHELILAVTCVHGVKRDESGPWSPSKCHQNDITILMTRVSFAQVPDERRRSSNSITQSWKTSDDFLQLSSLNTCIYDVCWDIVF